MCMCVLFNSKTVKQQFESCQGKMRAKEKRLTSNYGAKDKKSERRGPGKTRGGRTEAMCSQGGDGAAVSGGGYELGIIRVSHCLLFSNQLLSSAGP